MRPIALPFLAAALVAACSAPPAASSPAASPSSSPSQTPVASPSATPAPTLAPTPTPEPSAPAVGRAPAGAWSAIRWVDGGPLPLRTSELTVRGWSGGFVAFEQSPGSDDSGDELPVTIRSSVSTDGLHWSAPTTLETGFKGNLAISSIVEGPSGLLALAYPYGDTCGGPPIVQALWSSSDGVTWERLAMPKAFTTAAVRTIAGGPAGFIAFGTKSDGATQAIWTSPNGHAWTDSKLPSVASGALALDDVASFDDGFVLVGSVLGEEGCGGAAHIKAAVFFSADGAAWARASLPGASTDPAATYEVSTLLGRLIVTQALPDEEATQRAWSSTDGRTWTALGDVSSDLRWSAISDGRHIVVIGPDSRIGAPTIIGIDENGASTTLGQQGDGPQLTTDGPGWSYSVGPTGILAVRSDGGAARLGVPS